MLHSVLGSGRVSLFASYVSPSRCVSATPGPVSGGMGVGFEVPTSPPRRVVFRGLTNESQRRYRFALSTNASARLRNRSNYRAKTSLIFFREDIRRAPAPDLFNSAVHWGERRVAAGPREELRIDPRRSRF